MKNVLVINLLLILVGSCFALHGSSDTPRAERLSVLETKQWLEKYIDEVKNADKRKKRLFTAEKMKEWCDRCTPENAYQSLVVSGGNRALHFFCKEADLELIDHVFKKMFPKDYKRGTRHFFKVENKRAIEGPDAFPNSEEYTPLECIPACDWKVYDFLKQNYGIEMDNVWSPLADTNEAYYKRKKAEYKEPAPIIDPVQKSNENPNVSKNDGYDKRVYKTYGVKILGIFVAGFLCNEAYKYYRNNKLVNQPFTFNEGLNQEKLV